MKAVFLDRDGVINEVVRRGEKVHPPEDVAQFRFLPGVDEACAALREAGYLLVVVTNQPDVRRGTQRRERVEEMNQLVKERLAVDDVLTCFHDEADGCACRKPRPGLLLAAAERFGVALEESFMVGDRWVDIEAGRAAGCRTIFVDRGYGQRDRCAPDRIAQDLPEASRVIRQWREAR